MCKPETRGFRCPLPQQVDPRGCFASRMRWLHLWPSDRPPAGQDRASPQSPDRPETGGKNRLATGVPPILALDRLQRERTAAAVRLPAHRALQPFDRPGVDMSKTHLHRTNIGDSHPRHNNGFAVMRKNPAGAVMRKNLAGTVVQTGKPEAFGVRCPDRSGHG